MTPKSLSFSPNLCLEHPIHIFNYVTDTLDMISNTYMVRTNEIKTELLISLLSQTYCLMGSPIDSSLSMLFLHPLFPNLNNSIFKMVVKLLTPIFIITTLVKDTILYYLIQYSGFW